MKLPVLGILTRDFNKNTINAPTIMLKENDVNGYISNICDAFKVLNGKEKEKERMKKVNVDECLPRKVHQFS